MLEVVPAQSDMFEQIYDLLLEFGNPNLQRSDFRPLLEHTWEPKGQHGVVLLEGSRVVGFLGTVHSERIVDGRAERFCNLSSWIVKPESARGGGLRLVQALYRTRPHVTILTASRTTVALTSRMRDMKTLDEKIHVITGARELPDRLAERGLAVSSDPETFEARLTPADRRIWIDHLPHTDHLLFHGAERSCYVVFAQSKLYKAIRVHYVSDPALFAEHAESFAHHIAASVGADGVLIEPRLLGGHPLRIGFEVPLEPPPLCVSSLDRTKIDNLYSELVLFKF